MQFSFASAVEAASVVWDWEGWVEDMCVSMVVFRVVGWIGLVV